MSATSYRDGLVEAVEYYSYITTHGHVLCDAQMEQLIDVRDQLITTDDIGEDWAGLADEIINEQTEKRKKL